MHVLVVITLLITETDDGTTTHAQTTAMQEFDSRRSCGVAERAVRATANNIVAFCFEK